MKAALCTAAITLGLTTLSSAGDIFVPGDYSSIQAAINAATNGDVVWVDPGTYTETIDFLGKTIRVESTGSPADTTIDADGAGSVVTFQSGEGPDSVLKGFTITDGHAGGTLSAGGGILCLTSAPTIEGNVISDNQTNDFGFGAGIACFDSDAVIVDNEIVDNQINQGGTGIGIYLDGSLAYIDGNLIARNESSSFTAGGGIACQASSPWIGSNEIVENVLEDGDGGGVYLDSGSDATVVGNTIARNQILEVPVGVGSGGGIYVENSSPTIEDNWIQDNDAGADGVATGGGILLLNSSADVCGNVITGNTATTTFFTPTYGGGIYVAGASSPDIEWNTLSDNFAEIGAGIANNSSLSVSLEHCILYGNDDFGAVEIDDASATLTVTYSDVRGGWPGTGNIDADPSFLSDFSIPVTSPCAEAGDADFYTAGKELSGMPRVLDADLDGEDIVDMGAYEASHIRTKVSGDFSPGGTIRLEMRGTPGLLAFLFLGTAEWERPLRPLGALYVDLSAAYAILPIGVMEVDVTGTLPATLPPGLPLKFQGLALGAAGGNFSNLESRVLD